MTPATPLDKLGILVYKAGTPLHRGSRRAPEPDGGGEAAPAPAATGSRRSGRPGPTRDGWRFDEKRPVSFRIPPALYYERAVQAHRKAKAMIRQGDAPEPESGVGPDRNRRAGRRVRRHPLK